MKSLKKVFLALALISALGVSKALAASPYVVTISTVDPMGGVLAYTQTAAQSPNAPITGNARILDIVLANTGTTSDTVYLLKSVTSTVAASTATAVFVASGTTLHLPLDPDWVLSYPYLRKQSTASTIIGTIRYR